MNYTVIDNNTKHGITDYWWNEVGIEEALQNKDYVYLISSYAVKSLKTKD